MVSSSLSTTSFLRVVMKTLFLSWIRQKSTPLILPPDERLGAREERKIQNQTIPKEPEPRQWPLPFHIMVSGVCLWGSRASTGHCYRGWWALPMTTTATAIMKSWLCPLDSRVKSFFCSTSQFPKCLCAGAAKSGCDDSKSTLPQPPNVPSFTCSWTTLREEKFTLTFGK